MQFVTFIQDNELRIYIVFGLLFLWHLRRFLQSHQALRKAAYVLELETARRRRAVSSSVLVVLASVCGLVYLITHNIIPNVSLFLSPQSDSPVPILTPLMPTASPEVLVLPGQPIPILSGTASSLPQNTQVPAAGIGCDNPLAVIVSPLPGAVLSGKVEVQGTADIPDFAFYVLEISTLGDNWLNVHTQNEPVSSGVLGAWDSTRHVFGDHAFRLVVYKANGDFEEPCVIPVSIGGVP